jgi:septal ring factor EnvC (AmiA/AmiB activator)
MLEEQVDGLRKSLRRNEDIYAHRLKLFSSRLRVIYKEGKRNFWQELLCSKSFSDLVQNYKFFVMVASSDASLIEDLRERRDRISREETELTSMLYQVTVAEGEKKTELARLEKNREERKSALSRLEREEETHQRMIEELAAAEENLVDIIAGLEKKRDRLRRMGGDYGEPDFGSLKGRMIRPVEGVTARKFGKSRHPKYGTVTFNSGIDVKAREGSPIRAVARGRVEYSGALAGYGNCIIINHSGGYNSKYARTGGIYVEQGSQVEEGDVIAEVGPEGSSQGENFHFEIRHSKQAMDPGEWLK